MYPYYYCWLLWSTGGGELRRRIRCQPFVNGEGLDRKCRLWKVSHVADFIIIEKASNVQPDGRTRPELKDTEIEPEDK